MLETLDSYIADKDAMWLLSEIVGSFYSTRESVGLPLGNLTSQLFSNVYLNQFDQFVKHKLKAEYYIRYADDFVIISDDRLWLEKTLPEVKRFLTDKLNLTLHPDKISIEKVSSGVDYLGWVHFPDHRIIRSVTRRRMFAKIKQTNGRPETVQSYLGLLSHGNTKKLQSLVCRLHLGEI